MATEVHAIGALEELAPVDQILDLVEPGVEQLPALSDLRHPVAAYLNGLAASSRRPQLSALDWIAHRSTQVYTAETLPWHRLRRPHMLKIRGLLEELHQPATANRMLAALRGVLRECRYAQLLTSDEYQAATSIPAVRGSPSHAAETSLPVKCAAFSRPAPARREKDVAKTPPSGAGVTPPSWPWPTAVACAAPRWSPSTSPTCTWSPASCGAPRQGQEATPGHPATLGAARPPGGCNPGA